MTENGKVKKKRGDLNNRASGGDDKVPRDMYLVKVESLNVESIVKNKIYLYMVFEL